MWTPPLFLVILYARVHTPSHVLPALLDTRDSHVHEVSSSISVAAASSEDAGCVVSCRPFNG